jgi:hypothetical protein
LTDAIVNCKTGFGILIEQWLATVLPAKVKTAGAEPFSRGWVWLVAESHTVRCIQPGSAGIVHGQA